MEMVKVWTTGCAFCGAGPELVEVPREGYERWRAGAFIQNAMPTVPAAVREQLLSGTHDACFNRMFPPDDDE